MIVDRILLPTTLEILSFSRIQQSQSNPSKTAGSVYHLHVVFCLLFLVVSIIILVVIRRFVVV